MISECYECRYACRYPAYWWFPFIDPLCALGNPMHTKKKCIDYSRIGRGSR